MNENELNKKVPKGKEKLVQIVKDTLKNDKDFLLEKGEDIIICPYTQNIVLNDRPNYQACCNYHYTTGEVPSKYDCYICSIRAKE